MVRSAYRVFGPTAPVATLAAQIQQESGWKTNATSWVGAQGLAQFMPATAADMGRLHRECSPVNPFKPAWAFACRDRYLLGLRAAVQPPIADTVPLTQCSVWAFALRAYNGGLSWIQRDRRLAVQRSADPNNWRTVRGVNAGRREAAHRENREYPERIFTFEPRYRAAGWGAGLKCGWSGVG